MTKRRKEQIQSETPAQYGADSDQAIIDRALQILSARIGEPGQAITSPGDTKSFLTLQLAERKNEAFCSIWLDNRHRVLSFEVLFTGTIDGASVHPRVVVQRAMAVNAAAVIFAHNHPSGLAEPSGADKAITTRLIQALEYVDVRVLDHVIVGGMSTFSFAERGLL